MKKIKNVICVIAMLFAVTMNVNAQSTSADYLAVGITDQSGVVALTASPAVLCQNLTNYYAASGETYTDVTVEQGKGGIFYLRFRGNQGSITSFTGYTSNGVALVATKTSCKTQDNDCIRDSHGCVPAAGIGCACTSCPANAVCTKECSTTSQLQ